MTRVEDWSNADCISWVGTLSLPPGYSQKKIKKFTTFRSKLKEMFEENKVYKGKSLETFCQGSAILLRELEGEYEEDEPRLKFPIDFCRIVCEAYLAKRRADSANVFDQIVAQKSTTAAANTNVNDSSTFQVIIVGCPKKKRIVLNVSNNNTIADLKQFIYDLEGQAKDSFSLKCGSDLTDLTKTLKQCNIKPNTRILFWTRANGGTSASSSRRVKNRRHINFSKYAHIKATRAPDCLFLYTAAEGYSVAEMSCGHAMESESMFMYIQTMFNSSCSSIKMCCPLPKCKREWEWQVCCQVAGLTDDENDELSQKRELRQSIDMRACPNCGTFCKRNPSVAILRMNCQGCGGRDWCWECSQVWRGSGLVICNNTSCEFVQELNQQLAKSKWSVPYGWTELKVPEEDKKLPDMRACPACLTFIEKPSGCKHMECKACKHKFCYSCLKPQSDCEHYSHTALCKPHPAQQFK